ncbi:uncharacterized protein METZ01_LOCUS200981, partial [marine metagenome]
MGVLDIHPPKYIVTPSKKIFKTHIRRKVWVKTPSIMWS